MAQKKLIRFAAIKTFPNVLEYPVGMPGRWAEHFGNKQPLTLELACGRGEYTVGLSALHPERNYIGVDVKGNRIYIGAKKCLEEKRPNAAFLRTQISMLPIAFPLIAGSGTLTTIMSLKANFSDLNILAGILINCVVIYVVLKSLKWIERGLGPSGMIVIRKFFGVILLAIAVKIFGSNITGFGK